VGNTGQHVDSTVQHVDSTVQHVDSTVQHVDSMWAARGQRRAARRQQVNSNQLVLFFFLLMDVSLQQPANRLYSVHSCCWAGGQTDVDTYSDQVRPDCDIATS
jgi:hypothetical protein